MAQNKKSKKEIENEKQRKRTIIICSIGAALVAVIIVVLIIVLILQNGSTKNENSSQTSSFPTSTSSTSENQDQSVVSTADSSKPDTDISDVIDLTKRYYADINVKNYGKITVELNYDAAPLTVKNFVSLAQAKFYNGLTFHRIMNGFMMQGGDPLGNGTGGSEENLYGEFAANGYEGNTLSHTKGAISMARRSDNMNSASSQFFIVQGDNVTSSLDGMYACFGYVTEGLEIVDKICQDAKPTDNNGTIPTDQQPVIETITIRTEPKT